MTAEQRSKEPAETPEGSTLPSSSRRRLVRGAAGGAGVLLSVHAKTALGGGVCKSPSATMSGNTSPRAGGGTTCSGGRSPGYWVQPKHFGAWDVANVVHPTFSPALVECASGVGGLALSAISASGTTFQSVFGNDLTPKSGVVVLAPVSLWAIIYSPNSFVGPSQLARHLACAWLNANYFKSASALYAITPQQVKDMWTQLTTVGYYCPAGVGCTPATGWSSDVVKSYIENMYDTNAPVPNYCKSGGA